MKIALAGGMAVARVSQFVVYPGAPHALHADYRAPAAPAAAGGGFFRGASGTGS
ncbi:hypothetical protein [Acidovorax soli]|uniref:hypothetical protein n=1 Tax=Acidovorax soli TaxID=592050 RepID=UPI003CC79CAF